MQPEKSVKDLLIERQRMFIVDNEDQSTGDRADSIFPKKKKFSLPALNINKYLVPKLSLPSVQPKKGADSYKAKKTKTNNTVRPSLAKASISELLANCGRNSSLALT